MSQGTIRGRRGKAHSPKLLNRGHLPQVKVRNDDVHRPLNAEEILYLLRIDAECAEALLLEHDVEPSLSRLVGVVALDSNGCHLQDVREGAGASESGRRASGSGGM
jgi:hypothetical protein